MISRTVSFRQGFRAGGICGAVIPGCGRQNRARQRERVFFTENCPFCPSFLLIISKRVL